VDVRHGKVGNIFLFAFTALCRFLPGAFIWRRSYRQSTGVNRQEVCGQIRLLKLFLASKAITFYISTGFILSISIAASAVHFFYNHRPAFS